MTSDYDRWKTTPPSSARLNRIIERVSEMQDIQVMKECYARNIRVDDLFDDLRERLIDSLFEESKDRG